MTMHLQNRKVARPAFTINELLVVMAIIALLVIISVSAYIAVLRGAQQRAARITVQALAGAAEAYYNDTHDYPAMRLSDLGLTAPPSLATTPLPNADQSIAAMIYSLQYRSSAGDLLKSLPPKVLVPLTINGASCTVSDSGETRQLYTVHDPWGNAIQYIRPRRLSVPPASQQQADTYPLGPIMLNNQVLLISMGRDGQPGQQGTDTPKWNDDVDGKDYPNPAVLKLGKADDILVHVGTAR